MDWLKRFWNQPNKAYRNAFIAFFLLGVHFVYPSLLYAFAPEKPLAQLFWAGRTIFHQEYPLSEQSVIWRVLGAGNVFTLGLMCFMLAVNPKRFYAALIPLCVMKAFASIGFLISFLTGAAGGIHYGMFFGVFLWDGSNVLMFLYFGSRSRRSLLVPDAPRPIPYWFAETS